MIRPLLLAPLLLIGCSLPALAQWGADPAQAGAVAYCASRNQGQSIEQAEVAATQAMADVLQLSSGAVLAGLQVGNPALVARWRYLAASLCPESSASDGWDGFDGGQEGPAGQDPAFP